MIILNKNNEELEDKAELILHKMERPVSLSKDRFTPVKTEVTSNLTKEQYEANVKKAKEYIKDGDIFQVVLSQRFEVETDVDPFDVYRCLRTLNPSPYLYFFDFIDYQVVGASPEKLVSVLNGIVATKPIAGTVPRGKTKEEDDMLVRQLVNDPKERAEHTMLVDLGRNDVGKVSKFGTVEVKNFMTVEKYSKVTHLVSDVQGELRDDENPINALMSVLPAGTLSGAPKVRAMEIIDELEIKNEVFTVEPLDILDLMEILIPVLQSGPSYLKMEKDMCRQEQESSMTLFQRKNLWRQRIKH